MKLKIKRDQLSKLLSVAAAAINSHIGIPILANVKLSASGETLEVTGNSGDLEIRNSCKAKVEQPGEATVNPRKMLLIVNGLTCEDVTLELTAKHGVTIEGGKDQEYCVKGLPATDFPVFPGPLNPKSISLEQRQLKALIKTCSFAICKDATRFTLLGIAFKTAKDGLEATATDARRVAIKVDTSVKGEGFSVTMPSKVCAELASLLAGKEPVEILVDANKLAVKAAGFTITAKLIEGSFPDMRSKLPQEFNTSVKLNREELIAAANRVSAVTSEKSNGIRLGFEKKRLTVSASSDENGDGSEKFGCKLEGEPVEIAVNPRYLIDSLTEASGAEVSIKFADARLPFVISDESGFISAISPLLK